MKPVKQLFNESLQWSFGNNGYTLQSGNEEVLCLLVHHSGAKADFSFDSEDYKIVKKGFWSPSIVINDRSGVEVLHMKKHFFGTSADVVLAVGILTRATFGMM